MKKALKIILPAIGIALIVFMLIHYVLTPRIATYLAIQDIMEANHVTDLGETGLPFTEYSLTDDSLVMVETPHYTIGIPVGFHEITSTVENSLVYGNETEEYKILMLTNAYEVDVNFLDPENYKENNSVVSINEKILAKGFQKLGYGMPDNYYNTCKCALSITEDDYNFFSLSESLAYCCLVTFRTSMVYSDGIDSHTYIYETEDKNAIICEYYSDQNNLYVYRIDLIRPDDLKTPHSITLWVDNPKTAYAIINSIEFKD